MWNVAGCTKGHLYAAIQPLSKPDILNSFLHKKKTLWTYSMYQNKDLFFVITSVTESVKGLHLKLCLHNQMSHLFTAFLFSDLRGGFRATPTSIDGILIWLHHHGNTAAPDNQCSVDFHATCEVTEAGRIFFIPIRVLCDLIWFNIWFDPDLRDISIVQK